MSSELCVEMIGLLPRQGAPLDAAPRHQRPVCSQGEGRGGGGGCSQVPASVPMQEF